MEIKTACPKCNGDAQSVGFRTVKHLVKDEIRDRVRDKDYFVCLEQDCDVVYFSQDNETILEEITLRSMYGLRRMQIPNISAIAAR